MLYTVTLNQVNELIGRYKEKGGEVYVIEGCLTDNYILTGEGLKTTIIKEHYLNEWSSDSVIRQYNRCPEKYAKVMELLDDDENEKAERLFFN